MNIVLTSCPACGSADTAPTFKGSLLARCNSCQRTFCIYPDFPRGKERRKERRRRA